MQKLQTVVTLPGNEQPIASAGKMTFQLPSPPKVRREIQINTLVSSKNNEYHDSFYQSPLINSSSGTQFVPIVSPRQIPMSSAQPLVSTSQVVNNSQYGYWNNCTPSQSDSQADDQGLTPTSLHQITQSISPVKEQYVPEETFKMNQSASCVKSEPMDALAFKSVSSIDLESEMVDSAIDNVMSLPHAFNEVVECQKDQSNEIERQQEMLRSLKEKLVEVAEKREELSKDVTEVTHKIYITEEKKRAALKQCKEYDIEIRQKIAECEKQRNKVKDLEEEINQNKKLFLKYQDLICNHRKEVSKFEETLDVFKELEEMKDEIAELQAKFDIKDEETDNILSGKTEDQLQSKITSTEDVINQLQTDILEYEQKISHETERQGQVQVSLTVLQKKNTAQLTRLKKQFKVAQQSSRQWHDQISQLQKSVDELKHKLGQ